MKYLPLCRGGDFCIPQLVKPRSPLRKALQWSHLGCRAVNRCAHDVKSRTTITIESAVSAPRAFCAATWTGEAMSAKVQGWVWDLDLAAQPKLLLLWLANRATDAGVCFPTKRELGKRTGLSERMVRYHLDGLARERDDGGEPRAPLLSIIERRVAADRNTSNVYVICVPWAVPEAVRAELNELKHIPNKSLKGVGTTGCTQGGGDDGLHPVGTTGCTQVGDTGCTENRSPVRSHRITPPIPPEDDQQQQGVVVASAERVDTAGTERRADPDQDDAAEELANAFYGGLGAGPEGVTAAIRRRDVAIARQLLAAGATAAQAEAYAREISAASGRIAPVDLRSFERERLGWLARRRGGDVSQRRLVDRSGQPPSWRAARSRAEPVPGAANGAQPPIQAPGPSLSASEASSDRLGDALRGLLLRGDQQQS